jgi:hypothetical protein
MRECEYRNAAGDAIARIVTTLNATYEKVPPRGSSVRGR